MKVSLVIFRRLFALVFLAAVVGGCAQPPRPNTDFNQFPSPQISADSASQTAEPIPSATFAPSETATSEIQDQASRPFLMVIENVFFIKGRGTVLTGHIQQGTVKKDDAVVIIGFQDEIINTVVTGVEMFHQLLETGAPGDNVGLLVQGVEADLVQAGMVVSQPGVFNTYSEAMTALGMEVGPPPAPVAPLLMQIAKISVIPGRGLLLTGTIARGAATADMAVVIIGPDNQIIATQITVVEISGQVVDWAVTGEYAGILVTRVDETLVQPGMVLAQAGSVNSYEDAILQLK